LENIYTCPHIKAGSHEKKIKSNVVSLVLELAVMVNAGFPNLKTNL
jgi:hypothetical protein